MQYKNIFLATWGRPAVGHVQGQLEFPRRDPGGKPFSPQLYFEEGRSLPSRAILGREQIWAAETGKHVTVSLAMFQQSKHEGTGCPRDQIPNLGRYFNSYKNDPPPLMLSLCLLVTPQNNASCGVKDSFPLATNLCSIVLDQGKLCFWIATLCHSFLIIKNFT